VSDNAKFCHNCGSGIATEGDIGNITDKACPACKKDHFLHTRQFRPDHPAVLECSRCVGIWLTHDYFEKVMKDAVTVGEIALRPEQAQPNKLVAHSNRNPVEYRKCPDCDQFMARENFARRSGVIVDSCMQHGKWFDEEELVRILTWVQAGGMIKSAQANLTAEQDKLRQAKRRLANAKEQASYTYTSGNDLRVDAAITLFSTLFR